MCLASILKLRADKFHEARLFFKGRGLIEVDCPSLVPFPPIDANIHVIEALLSENQSGYLHTSPEYAMKKLLAQGSGDIFYLGHVFRKEEKGRLHHHEFTMAEWYRIGFSFQDMIQETCQFLSLFLRPLPIRILTYREAFLNYAGIDYASISVEELQKKSNHLTSLNWDKTTYLHDILSSQIEPFLGTHELTVLVDYPPQEAALAKLASRPEGRVALRFEIYHQGIELANGYEESTDSSELRSRFLEENKLRLNRNEQPYPLDESFLDAVSRLPPCCGVSVGFDRALMLCNQGQSIQEILPYSWDSPID